MSGQKLVLEVTVVFVALFAAEGVQQGGSGVFDNVFGGGRSLPLLSKTSPSGQIDASHSVSVHSHSLPGPKWWLSPVLTDGRTDPLIKMRGRICAYLIRRNVIVNSRGGW